MLRWQELTGLSDEQLGALDVAEVNLACAAELPDAPGEAKAAECIDRLNHYAKCVAHNTQVRMTEFLNRPEEYKNSEGAFRMVCLVRVLQRQFGVRYNAAKIPDEVPFNTEDVFIHGALLGAGGTCASLPVVYAAVGRRLGYPLKLVSAFKHQFLRWDDPGGERFNVEVNNKGIADPPDDHYRQGRFQKTKELEHFAGLLTSHTPREELSWLLSERGHLWIDHRRLRKAVEALGWSWAMAPGNGLVRNLLVRLLVEWQAELRPKAPPGFPPLHHLPSPRRFPQTVPLKVERDILCLEATENLLKTPDLNEKWWEPMRRGRAVSPMPTGVTVTCCPGGGCQVHFTVG